MVAQINVQDGAVVTLFCSWNLRVGQDAVIGATFHGTSDFRAELLDRPPRSGYGSPR